MTELSRWVLVDDRDSRIQYTSGWSNGNGDTQSANSHGNFGLVYGNTLKVTSASDNGGFTFTFTGDRARIYGTNYPDYESSSDFDPDWECTLNGRVHTASKKDPYAYRQNQWQFCEYTDLAPGQHTIGLNAKGRSRPFYFDFIRYRASTTVSGETMHITRDDADIQYNGSWGPLAGTAHYTSTPQSSVSFRFIGTGLSLQAMAPKDIGSGPSQGTYTIDGGNTVPFTIQGVGSTTQYNRIIFSTPQLSNGEHTVVVTYRGSTSTTPLVVSNFVVSGGTNQRASTTNSSPETPNPPSSGTDSGSDGGGGSSGGTGSNNGGSSGSNSGGSGGGNDGGGETTNGGPPDDAVPDDDESSGGSGSGNGGSSGNSSSGNGNSGSNSGNGDGDGSTGSENNSSGGSSNNAGGSTDGSGKDPGNNTVYLKGSDSSGADNLDTPGLEGSGASGKSDTPVGAIVGGVLGALTVALMGILAIVVIRRRKRRNGSAPSILESEPSGGGGIVHGISHQTNPSMVPLRYHDDPMRERGSGVSDSSSAGLSYLRASQVDHEHGIGSPVSDSAARGAVGGATLLVPPPEPATQTPFRYSTQTRVTRPPSYRF